MCGDDIQLISCSGCYLYLLTSLRHATVAGCTDCQIVLGAVSGAWRLEMSRHVHVFPHIDYFDHVKAPQRPKLELLFRSAVNDAQEINGIWCGRALVKRTNRTPSSTDSETWMDMSRSGSNG